MAGRLREVVGELAAVPWNVAESMISTLFALGEHFNIWLHFTSKNLFWNLGDVND